MFSLQNLDKITFHIDVAVAIEGAAAFGVAGKSGYEVRIFDQFVDVADEGTAAIRLLAISLNRLLSLIAYH